MDEGREAENAFPSLQEAQEKHDPKSSLLAAVSCAEDRILIIDVLNAIRMCRHPHGQLCTSWSVLPCKTGYTLTAYLPKPSTASAQGAIEVTHDDFSMIQSVNLMRVRVSVAHLNADTWALQIHITSHRSPVSFTVHDTLRFTQRRSIVWNSSSSPATIMDQGKTFIKNIFGKSEQKFSIAQDNTNPMHASHGDESDCSRGHRKKRERDENE